MDLVLSILLTYLGVLRIAPRVSFVLIASSSSRCFRTILLSVIESLIVDLFRILSLLQKLRRVLDVRPNRRSLLPMTRSSRGSSLAEILASLRHFRSNLRFFGNGKTAVTFLLLFAPRSRGCKRAIVNLLSQDSRTATDSKNPDGKTEYRGFYFNSFLSVIYSCCMSIIFAILFFLDWTTSDSNNFYLLKIL